MIDEPIPMVLRRLLSPPVEARAYTRIFVRPIASGLNDDSTERSGGPLRRVIWCILTQIAVPAVRIIPRGWGSAFAIDARFESVEVGRLPLYPSSLFKGSGWVDLPWLCFLIHLDRRLQERICTSHTSIAGMPWNAVLRIFHRID